MSYFYGLLCYSLVRFSLPKQKLNGWSLESNITAILHQGFVLPILLFFNAAHLIYSTTFAYLFSGLYESWTESNYVHIAHHGAGLMLIGLMEMKQETSLWWWGAICTAALEIGGLGLSIVDLFPTPATKYGCFWLYGCSRGCVCIILWKIFGLLPTLTSLICVSIPSILLIIHNFYVISQLYQNIIT